jgi:hypothetical protein
MSKLFYIFLNVRKSLLISIKKFLGIYRSAKHFGAAPRKPDVDLHTEASRVFNDKSCEKYIVFVRSCDGDYWFTHGPGADVLYKYFDYWQYVHVNHWPKVESKLRKKRYTVVRCNR